MALYSIEDKVISGLKKTSYSVEGLQERYDLQFAIKNNISILDPDCLIISEEFSDWEDSRRRIDLLAIDKQANLVVIELKRDEIGAHMELQALRYAAMISTMSFTKACEYYQQYLYSNNIEENAKEKILEFIDLDETEITEFGKDIRIILASSNFGKELTTTALWLRDKAVDIKCIRITPYTFKGNVLINAEQIIPVPELEDYQVKFREKRIEQTSISQRTEKDYSRYKYKNMKLTKGRLMFNLFYDWIKKHQPYDLNEIKDKLSGISSPTKFSIADEIPSHKKGRFNLNEDDLIELPSGEVVAISNQWGIGNIDKPLEFMKNDGFIFEKIES